MSELNLTKLFVYGTLKRGHGNHRLIADQRFAEEAVTAIGYRLVDLGPYPGLVRDSDNGLSVRGELWLVSECSLAELDDFEMSTDDYTREEIEIIGIPGPVWAYYYIGEMPPGATSGAEWPFG